MGPSAGTAWIDFKGDFSGLRREAEGHAAAVSRSFTSAFGRGGPVVAKQKQHLEQFTTAAKYATIGAAGFAAYGLKEVVKTGSEYETQLSRVEAVSGATGKQMAGLNDLAIELGAKTKFSAGEAAEGMYELSSAGFGVGEMTKAIKGDLALAAAANIDLGTATEIASNALRGFGLPASQSIHVADVLAQSVNSSSVEMEDLQLSLKYIGPVAKATGQSFEQMIAAVSVMGDAGIKGEQAGTTLRGGLLRLVDPTKQVNEGLKMLGLSSSDLTGPNGLLPLPAMVAKLESGMGGLSKSQQAQALASVFGKEAMSGMYELVDAGPAKLQRLTREFENSQGASSKAADIMLRNVGGAYEEFTGSLETLEIITFQEFKEPLRDALNDATEFVNEIAEIMGDDSLSFEERFITSAELIEQELGNVWDEANVGEHLAEAIDAAVPIVASHAGALAVEAVKGFTEGFMHADALGKAVMFAWALNFVGGKAAFAGVGRFLGISLGKDIAAGTAAQLGTSGTRRVVGTALAGAATEATWLGTDSRRQRSALRTQGMASLGRMNERQALAAQGGIFGNVAGKRAGRGFAGGMVSTLKGINWAGIGAVGIGFGLVDLIINDAEDRAQERSGDLAEALAGHNNASLSDLPGTLLGGSEEWAAGEVTLAIYEKLTQERIRLSKATIDDLEAETRKLDLTKEARGQAEAMFALLRQGNRLGIGVDANMDPAQLSRLTGGLRTLRGGWLDSFEDIRKVTRRNLSIISAELGTKTDEGRKLAARNYRATAVAMGVAMADSGKITEKGLDRQKALFRNADLITGNDPFGIAKGFRESWKEAGGINERQRKRAITDLGKMPAEARQKAFETMVQHGRGLVQGGKIPREDLRSFISDAKTKFTSLKVPAKQSSLDVAIGVAGNFGLMGEAVANVLRILQDNSNNVLGKFNADPLTFAIQSVGSFLGIGKEQRKQSGGFIVPGAGDGDTFRTALRPGSFIENREAARASAMGFMSGGLTPVALEPGERVYTPEEVSRIGLHNLERRNAEIPRFQVGGLLRKPRLTGTDGPLLDMGRGFVDRAYAAANSYLERQKPKTGTSGGGNFHGGSGIYPGVSGDTDFTPALGTALSDMARATGTAISVTSGWRSYEEQAALYQLYQEGRGNLAAPPGSSNHEDGRAADISPGRETFGGVAGSYGLGFTVPSESWHIELLQLGGLIQKLLQGGSVADWDSLIGPSWDNDQLATLAHIVEMSSPGRMAQKAQGESTGNRKAVGNDRPGVEGLGLWQITTGVGNDDLISKYGGREAMFHPYLNASAGKEILDEQGMGAWYAPFVGPVGRVDSDLAERMRGIAGGGGAALTAGAQKAAEGKKRKANYESRLQALTKEVAEARTNPSKQSKLWRLIKFWGRVGVFDQDERAYMLQAVQVAASQVSPADAVTHLQRLAGYAKGHGEITGQDPSDFRSLTDAMERAQDRGKEKREKTVERQKKRIDGIHARVRDRISKRAAFEDLVALIGGKRGSTEQGEEFASQLVTLEPEVLGDAYVDRERGAYTDVLGRTLNWRNQVVTAQDYATAEIARFQEQIDAIEALKPEGGKAEIAKAFGKAIKGGDKKLIGGLIQHFAGGGKPQAAKAFGEAMGGGSKKGAAAAGPDPAEQYKKAAYKIPLLEQAIKDAETMRDETWAGELEEIQGLSGPKGLLSSLPSEPVAGAIGGRIFEIQNSIRELELKLGSVNSGREAEQLALVREALMLANQRNLARGIEEHVYAIAPHANGLQAGGPVVMPPYAGKAHTGAIVPGAPHEERTMILRGREGVFTEEQMQAMGDGGGAGPKVEVNVYEATGEVNVKVNEQDVEPIVNRISRGNVRRAGRGLATPGVFGE